MSSYNNRLQSYNNKRSNILKKIRLENDFNNFWNPELMKILNNTFIDCEWCNESIRFNDKYHINNHFN